MRKRPSRDCNGARPLENVRDKSSNEIALEERVKSEYQSEEKQTRQMTGYKVKLNNDQESPLENINKSKQKGLGLAYHTENNVRLNPSVLYDPLPG